MTKYKLRSLHNFENVYVIDELALGEGNLLQGISLVIFKYTKIGLPVVLEYREFHRKFIKVKNE